MVNPVGSIPLASHEGSASPLEGTVGGTSHTVWGIGWSMGLMVGPCSAHVSSQRHWSGKIDSAPNLSWLLLTHKDNQSVPVGGATLVSHDLLIWWHCADITVVRAASRALQLTALWFPAAEPHALPEPRWGGGTNQWKHINKRKGVRQTIRCEKCNRNANSFSLCYKFLFCSRQGNWFFSIWNF